YNADLAGGLGNLYSRVVTQVGTNFNGVLEGTAHAEPGVIYTEVDTETTVQQVQAHIEACQYNQALDRIWQQLLKPSDQYIDRMEPWKLVKSDADAAKRVLYDLIEQLRCISILLKPFLPRIAEKIYRSFNFPKPWEEVRHEDVWVHPLQEEDLRVTAELKGGKPRPLLPRIA